MPATPYDAKGLLKAAIREDNPVVIFEHRHLYSLSGPVPDEEYVVPIGQAEIKRTGHFLSGWSMAIRWWLPRKKPAGSSSYTRRGAFAGLERKSQR